MVIGSPKAPREALMPTSAGRAGSPAISNEPSGIKKLLRVNSSACAGDATEAQKIARTAPEAVLKLIGRHPSRRGGDVEAVGSVRILSARRQHDRVADRNGAVLGRRERQAVEGTGDARLDLGIREIATGRDVTDGAV